MNFRLQKAGGFFPKKGTYLPGVSFFLLVTVSSEMVSLKSTPPLVSGHGKGWDETFPFLTFPFHQLSQ